MASVDQPVLEDRILPAAEKVLGWVIVSAVVVLRGFARGRGFTLFWLLGVAHACIQIMGTTDSHPVPDTWIQIRRIEDNLAIYPATHDGRYPTTAEDLTAARRYFPDNEVPTDAWGNAFYYFSPGVYTGLPYEIISAGPDGEFDTADDIRSWERPW